MAEPNSPGKQQSEKCQCENCAKPGLDCGYCHTCENAKVNLLETRQRCTQKWCLGPTPYVSKRKETVKTTIQIVRQNPPKPTPPNPRVEVFPETVEEVEERIEDERIGIRFIYGDFDPFNVATKLLETIWTVIDIWDERTVKMVPLRGLIRVIRPRHAARMMDQVRLYRALPKHLRREDQKLDLTREILGILFQKGKIKDPEILAENPVIVSGGPERILLFKRK